MGEMYLPRSKVFARFARRICELERAKMDFAMANNLPRVTEYKGTSINIVVQTI